MGEVQGNLWLEALEDGTALTGPAWIAPPEGDCGEHELQPHA